ncbi:MAG: sterol desaturase family protein [bacterium]|nr:sterol desaturase family protein [bacterium]
MSYVAHHATILASFLVTYVLLYNQIQPGFILAYLTAFNIMLLLTLEQLLPYKKSSSPFSDQATPSDLGHFLVSSFGRAIIGGGVLMVATLQGEGGVFGMWPRHLPWMIQFLIVIFVWEAVVYWRHRIQHGVFGVEYFWPMHAIHHDTKVFHTFKAIRAHFLDDWFSYGFEVFIPLVLGAPVEIYVWVYTWNISFGNLTHANIRQDNPAWLHYFLPTIQLHQWHHKVDGMNKNLANNFPLIDILFGTYQHPSTYKKSELGCGIPEMPTTFLWQLWYPVRLLNPWST